MRFLVILCLSALLAACGSSQTYVVKQPLQRTPFETAKLVQEADQQPVAHEYTLALPKAMTKQFFDGKGAFKEGDDGLQVKYRFVSFDPGKRHQRWLSGGIGGWGEGAAVVEVWFEDANGTELSRIKVEGTISAGAGGGSEIGAIERAAEQAAQYAFANFR